MGHFKIPCINTNLWDLTFLHGLCSSNPASLKILELKSEAQTEKLKVIF